MLNRILSWLLLPAIPFLLAVPALAQQDSTGNDFRLTRVQVTGTNRYTESEVVKVSGLSVGQVVTVADLDRVTERMARTGLFTSVRYRYVTANGQMEVTFDVEEAEWTVPVVFDNFVWFNDQELVAAVRQDVPSFDGTAPTDGGSTDFIAQALQHVLETRGIQGGVEFRLYTDLRTGDVEYTFRVKDAGSNLKTCALHVEGASGVPEGDLLVAAQAVIGNDYSRLFLRNLSNGTLRQVYRQRGYWRAAFDTPSASLDDTPGCVGVTVTLHVSEGMAYAWEHAQWSGTTAIATDNLDKLLGMRPGEVADVSKIEAGLRDVKSAFGKLGYLLEEGTFAPELDDSTQRAVFHVEIDEGPRFRMGTLVFVGLSEAHAADLTRKWRLQAGEVYDESYLTQFVAEHIRPLQRRGALSRGMSYELGLDRDARIVDVRIIFR